MGIVDRAAAGGLMSVSDAKEIIKEMPKSSVAMQLFRRVTMSAKQTKLPVLSILPTAGFVNGDTGLKPVTAAGWDGKVLEAEPIAAICIIPEDVFADANYSITDEIKPYIAEAIGAVLDAAVFFGINKPTTWGEALIPGAIAHGKTIVRGAANKDLAYDISQTMRKIETKGHRVRGFAGSPELEADLRDLRDGDGRFLYLASMVEGQPDKLYGRPIQVADNGSWDPNDATLVCGDWSKAILGVRQDMTWKLLDQATLQLADGSLFHLAQQDSIALRVVTRLAYQNASPATRLAKNVNDRFPFAALLPED